MEEEFLNTIYQNIGGEKVGTFDEFKQEFSNDIQFQETVYNNIGGEKIGTFEEFQAEVGLGQPAPSQTPTNQPQSQGNTQPVTEEKNNNNNAFEVNQPSLDEIYESSKATAAFEEETGVLSSVLSFGEAAVEGISNIFSGNIFGSLKESGVKRDGEVTDLKTKALDEIDAQLPDDIGILDLESASQQVIEKQRTPTEKTINKGGEQFTVNKQGDEKTVTITATQTSQAMKKRRDRLSDITQHRISKLRPSQQETINEIDQYKNNRELLQAMLDNEDFLTKQGSQFKRAIQAKVNLIDQQSEVGKEVDRYSDLILNITNISQESKEEGLSDEQLKERVYNYLDNEDVRKAYDNGVLDAVKSTIDETAVANNFILRGFNNLGSVVEGSVSQLTELVKNSMGFGGKDNSPEGIRQELGTQSAESLVDGINKALLIDGTEIQESSIVTDVIDKGGIRHEITKQSNGEFIVSGLRDVSTGKKIPLLQPYLVEGSDLDLKDKRKEWNWTGLGNQAYRTMFEMLPMMGGGTLGAATNIKGMKYLGTAAGTTSTMFKRSMDSYVDKGADYEDAGGMALLESFLVAGLENVIGIEKSVINKLNGGANDVIKALTKEAFTDGIKSISSPKGLAKKLSELTRRMSVKSQGVVKGIGEEVVEEMVLEAGINRAITEGLGLEQEEFTVNGALQEFALTVAASGPLSIFTAKGDTRNKELVKYAKINKEETIKVFDQLIEEAQTDQEIEQIESSKEVFVNSTEREEYLNEVTLDKDDKGVLTRLSDRISELEVQSKTATTKKGREKAKKKADELTEYLDNVAEVAQTGNPIDVKKGNLVRHEGKVYKVKDIDNEEGYRLTPLTSDKEIVTKALVDKPAKKEKSSVQSDAAVVTPSTGDPDIATNEDSEGSEVTGSGETPVAASDNSELEVLYDGSEKLVGYGDIAKGDVVTIDGEVYDVQEGTEDGDAISAVKRSNSEEVILTPQEIETINNPDNGNKLERGVIQSQENNNNDTNTQENIPDTNDVDQQEDTEQAEVNEKIPDFDVDIESYIKANTSLTDSGKESARANKTNLTKGKKQATGAFLFKEGRISAREYLTSEEYGQTYNQELTDEKLEVFAQKESDKYLDIIGPELSVNKNSQEEAQIDNTDTQSTAQDSSPSEASNTTPQPSLDTQGAEISYGEGRSAIVVGPGKKDNQVKLKVTKEDGTTYTTNVSKSKLQDKIDSDDGSYGFKESGKKEKDGNNFPPKDLKNYEGSNAIDIYKEIYPTLSESDIQLQIELDDISNIENKIMNQFNESGLDYSKVIFEDGSTLGAKIKDIIVNENKGVSNVVEDFVLGRTDGSIPFDFRQINYALIPVLYPNKYKKSNPSYNVKDNIKIAKEAIRLTENQDMIDLVDEVLEAYTKGELIIPKQGTVFSDEIIGNEQVQGNAGGVQSNGDDNVDAVGEVNQSQPKSQGSVQSDGDSTKSKEKKKKEKDKNSIDSISAQLDLLAKENKTEEEQNEIDKDSVCINGKKVKK